VRGVQGGVQGEAMGKEDKAQTAEGKTALLSQLGTAFTCNNCNRACQFGIELQSHKIHCTL